MKVVRLRRLSAIAMILALSSCGARPVPTEGETYDKRFIGVWAAHSHYYRGVYRFEDGGRVTWLASQCPAATRCDELWFGEQGAMIKCSFGERWRSEGSGLLLVDGNCDDGVARELRFRFDTEPAFNGGPGGAAVRLSHIGDYAVPPERTASALFFSHWCFKKCDLTAAECSCF